MNESVVIQKVGADQPDVATMLDMFRRMLLIRAMETTLRDLFSSGEIGGTLHLGIGQEAVQVGVCTNLRKDDYITATHRGHGECLAKGADINAMMAEFLGKRTGVCKGKAGDMHTADFSVGDIAATPIVGAGLPLAVGAALSAKMRGTDQVAVPFFGDGANNQGTFHESLNLASIWKLPVVFVCENNLYAESTRITDTTPVKIADRAASYAMPGVQVDGMDVLQVYSTAKSAVQRAQVRRRSDPDRSLDIQIRGTRVGIFGRDLPHRPRSSNMDEAGSDHALPGFPSRDGSLIRKSGSCL